MSVSSTSESILALTPAAVEQVQAMQEQPDNAGKALRVYVEQGGCSGMQYGLVFDEKREGDMVAEQDGVTALVDSFSAEYVRGSVVDFSDALTGGGFKITNPKAKQSCGCGKSFET
jgi:iron-sulfur cluster assembly accessory protein